MKKFIGFEHGIGMGGWLTNYKRFHVLKPEQQKILTIGDVEHFNSYITEKDVKYVADCGFDHIRLGFDQVVLDNENGEFREEILTLIDNFISWCEKYGVNVVLNLHKAIGNYCDVGSNVSLFDDENLQKGFVDFWERMEKRYANKPAVAFELLNEVCNTTAEKWNDLAERTLVALRKLNSTRKIIIGTIDYNSVEWLHALKVYDDENVIYTFHTYAPFEFTHQRGVLQATTCFYNRDMPYPCDIERYRDYRKFVCGYKEPYRKYEVMDRAYIYDYLAPAKEFIEKHPNAILWCGEFGVIRHAKEEWREAWFKDVISFLKENEIPYCTWNYLSTPNDGNRFSLVDDENRQFLCDSLLNVLLAKE